MWLFKTRNRINNTKRFIDACIQTNTSTPIYVRLDDDDPALEEYHKLNWPNNFNVITGPRVFIGKAMDEMFHKFPNEQWYGLLADDLIPFTQNWDSIISKAAIPNKIVAFEEKLKLKLKGRFEHMCVSGNIIRNFGWFGLPCTEHYYQDHIWRELAAARPEFFVYLSDVVVKHDHPKHTKVTQIDNTYLESRKLFKSDTKSYQEWEKDNLSSLIEKLDYIKI